MSIMIVESEITHRYLMNKSKSDLHRWLADQRKTAGQSAPDPIERWTKESLASTIMMGLRAAAQKDAEDPQAFHDLDIPFGAVTTGYDGKQWVFCGWGQTTVSREAYLVREVQPGERLSVVTPYTYHCTKTVTLLARFPGLEQYRRVGVTAK